MPSNNHAKQVRGYDDVFLTCRDLRHVWEVVGFYRAPDGMVRRLLDCARCGTQRVDRWRLSGERVSSSYSYQDGYRVTDGFDVWEVRKEVISRARIYKDEKAMVRELTKAGQPKVRRGSGDK